MKTIVTGDPVEAAAYLQEGDLVAFPTETVYGLGADALSERAVQKIYAAKKRPADNPLIVHLATPDRIPEVAAEPSASAYKLIETFMPGPITLILRRRPLVPSIVSAGLPSIGVRVPQHPTAQAFLDACARPVAAPSANLSGRPSPTTWQAVLQDLDERIACLLRGDASEVGLESTVIDCTGDRPTVLRAGAITLEALRRVLPGTTLAQKESDTAASPGTRHRHYAPSATVRLISHPDQADADMDASYIGLDAPAQPDDFNRVCVCTDIADYAHRLFAFFRTCDAESISIIYCQEVPREGLGLALMDRIERAEQR